MTRPLISDAAGAALSPLWLGEFLKNVRADFGLESADSKEVSGLPLEEVEVLEQPSEGMLVKGSEWEERAGALHWGLLDGGWNRKYSEVSPELEGGRSPKNAEGVRGRSWKDSEMSLERKTGRPLTTMGYTPFKLNHGYMP